MIPAARNPGAPQEDASVQALRKHYEEDMKLHNTTRATLKDLGTQGDIERERNKAELTKTEKELVKRPPIPPTSPPLLHCSSGRLLGFSVQRNLFFKFRATPGVAFR